MSEVAVKPEVAATVAPVSAEAAPAQAVAVVEQNNNSSIVVQSPLFNLEVFNSAPQFGSVFRSKAVLSKGVSVGTQVISQGKREMAKAFGLEGKTNAAKLESQIVEVRKASYKEALAEMMRLADQGLMKFVVRRMTNGSLQRTLVSRDMPETDRIAFEKYAEAMGIPLEEAHALINKYRAKADAPVVEIETTITTTAPVAVLAAPPVVVEAAPNLMNPQHPGDKGFEQKAEAKAKGKPAVKLK